MSAVKVCCSEGRPAILGKPFKSMEFCFWPACSATPVCWNSGEAGIWMSSAGQEIHRIVSSHSCTGG